MFGVETFLTFGLALAVIFGVAGAFYGGLKTKIIEKKTLPNQGIILTIKNAVLGGLGIWLIMFLDFRPVCRSAENACGGTNSRT